MDVTRRIEHALGQVVAQAEGAGCPPRLGAAIRYAVFPGGARVRPRLCLAVAGAERREGAMALAEAAAVAIELLHCASLVHDDLPCFDDAPMRRGKPSVHCAYGERIAVLVGDALIVLAFQSLARVANTRDIAPYADRVGSLLVTVARAVGAPMGIVAGQAWECEPRVPLRQYQCAKTGALFAAATVAGAQAAGADPNPWRGVGEILGEAYQVADDIRDVVLDTDALGKPAGRDLTLDRPSVVRELGLDRAIAHFDHLVRTAQEAIPACSGALQLRALLQQESERLLPERIARRAAA